MAKIAVFGLGYVGLSNAVLLARRHEVRAVDVLEERVALIGRGVSPIRDEGLAESLAADDLNLTATTDGVSSMRWADVVVVATPTDYDPDSHSFDTSSVEGVVGQVARVNPGAVVVVKSTVPVGFTGGLAVRFPGVRFVFSPEFLREGSALLDNLRPSRVIVSGDREAALGFGGMLVEAALNDPPFLFMGSREAEAVKLFSNQFLATRVAFFNELDTFASVSGLDALDLVRGVSADPRVGDFYNNPSFGFGGYCLPKDTRQLVADFAEAGAPESLVSGVVEANDRRLGFVVSSVLDRGPRRVGVYRLAMKAGSDNSRSSAVLEVASRLAGEGVEVVVFDPSADGGCGYPVCDSLEEFAGGVDVILANRWDAELLPWAGKVFTRDLFGSD